MNFGSIGELLLLLRGRFVLLRAHPGGPAPVVAHASSGGRPVNAISWDVAITRRREGTRDAAGSPGEERTGKHMRLTELTRILAMRARLRRRTRWSRERVLLHQEKALAGLLEHARRSSPYYQRVLKPGAPLAAQPLLTKATLLEHYDEIVTDRRLRLADLVRFVDGNVGDELYLGRYRVAATAGSSGRRSTIPSDPAEWATVIASYARANEWAGIRVSPRHRPRMAVVSSKASFHQSNVVARSVDGPLVRTLRLDAADDLQATVTALNEFNPEVLVAYASMLRILADEQLAGRLRIAPRAVNCSSEVLTAQSRSLAEQAWRLRVFEVYAATETAGIAAECSEHRGMHAFEDLLILEGVDDDYQPVPDGRPAARLLATVLPSRTVPLLRYELTDRVTFAAEPCRCGLPFKLIASVDGRSDDLLRMAGIAQPTVRVHPVLFHRVLEPLPAHGWQVRQERSGLRVLLSRPAPELRDDEVRTELERALAAARVRPVPIVIEHVERIPSGAAGKRPLVVAAR